MMSSPSLPTPTSVRVIHAPGGHSSLSLAWAVADSCPRNQPIPKPRPIFQQQKPASFEPLNYQQPLSMRSFSLYESNQLLQEELCYYQNKNKILRQSIFGPAESEVLKKNSHFVSPHRIYPLNFPCAVRMRQQEPQLQSLQLALKDRERQRTSLRAYREGQWRSGGEGENLKMSLSRMGRYNPG